MILIEKTVTLSEIMIDPNNPRFPDGHKNKNQNEIMEVALNDKAAKELLNSLNTCIRWVNKIVVMRTSNYNKEHTELKNYSYIAVEGNTRLACLKSGNVSGFNDSSEIPVLIAEKEQDEQENEFQDSILITQGIANVMVVKQWDQIAKAKHIHNLFSSKMELGTNFNTAISQISTELAMKKAECKKHIQRYSIYKKVDEVDRKLNASEWGYLEAFDVNPNTRGFIGLHEDMTWNEDIAEEVIYLIGDLVIKATKEVGHTKKFRDYFKKLVEDTAEHEDVVNKIQSFIDDKNDENLINAIEETKPEADEEEWQRKIKNAYKTISDLPANKDWSINLKPQLEKLKTSLNTGIKMIDLRNDIE